MAVVKISNHLFMKQLLFIYLVLFSAINVCLGQGRSIESIGITEITIIEIAPNGDVWAGSNGQGVAFYKADSLKWAYFNHANTPDLESDTITALYVNSIAGVQHAFVGTVSGATDFAASVPTAINSLPEPRVAGITYRPDSLWILTTNKIARYDSSGVYKTNFNSPLPNITCTQSGISKCVGLWSGTANNGCFFTADGVNFTYIDTTPPKQKLVDNRVNAIAIDDQCIAKFIGTKGGFSVCPVGNPCQNFTTANGLPQNDITSVALVCGKVWLGTRDSGVVIFTPPSTFTRLTKANGLPDNHVTSIGSNADNCTAYVASRDGSIALLDTNKTVLNVLSAIEKVNGQSFGVKVYPQPSAHVLNFDFEAEIAAGQLILTDMAGRTLQNIPLKNTAKVTTDVYVLSAGIYFYQLYSGNSLVKTGKVSITR